MKVIHKLIPLLGVIMLLGCDESTVFSNISVTLKGGEQIAIPLPDEKNPASTTTLPANPTAARPAERFEREIKCFGPYIIPNTGLTISYESHSRTGEHTNNDYHRIRHILTNTTDQPIEIERFTLLDGTVDLKGTTPQVVHTPKGTALFALSSLINFWCAIEHPMARYEVTPAIPASTREVPVKTDYVIANCTNEGKSHSTFEVPIETTDSTLTLSLAHQQGDPCATIYGIKIFAPDGKSIITDTPEKSPQGVFKDNTYTLTNVPIGESVVVQVTAGTESATPSKGTITLTGATAKATTLPTPLIFAYVRAYIPMAETLLPGKSISFTLVQGIFENASDFPQVYYEYIEAEGYTKAATER